MVDMLENLKGRITKRVKNMSVDQTDFLMDEKANRIGTLIIHLAAIEAAYQSETFEGRYFNEEEKLKWSNAIDLGDKARNEFKGKPIKYYLDIWSEVRKKTLTTLKTKDDKWLLNKLDLVTNYHYAWFHVMEHQANHMGQIMMIMARMPK